MAVTKQTYTAAATWNEADLASILTSALTDAGLLPSGWYDSFSNGVENRIMEVVHDAGKTYGKSYYWFMTSATGLHVQLVTGWNATTHVPVGTQYIDWLSNSTSAVTNHQKINTGTVAVGTAINITRYTSAIDTTMSMFVLWQGGVAPNTFMIMPPSSGIKSWVDLDKVMYSGFIYAATFTNTLTGLACFRQIFGLRRCHKGSALRGTTSTSIFRTFTSDFNYVFPGNANNTANNYNGVSSTIPGIFMPYNFNNNNPAYGTDSRPVCTGLPICATADKVLPADMAIAAHYANNTFSVFDKLIVSAGVEEWEVADYANNATVTTGASPLILARVI
jgi:hypothetical protein